SCRRKERAVIIPRKRPSWRAGGRARTIAIATRRRSPISAPGPVVLTGRPPNGHRGHGRGPARWGQAANRPAAQGPADGGDVGMRIGDVASVPTVLLVHEDPAFRDRVGLALRAEGFRVVRGTDGLEAVARWEAQRPDLLLLGDRLRVFDGVE